MDKKALPVAMATYSLHSQGITYSWAKVKRVSTQSGHLKCEQQSPAADLIQQLSNMVCELGWEASKI